MVRIGKLKSSGTLRKQGSIAKKAKKASGFLSIRKIGKVKKASVNG